MVHDEIDSAELVAEVVRLDIDRGHAVVVVERLGRHGFDVDVEQVGHANVLGTGHAPDRSDDGRGLGASEQVAQCQPAGHRVGVGIVVEQDEDPVRVGEVALVLQNLRACQGTAEFSE